MERMAKAPPELRPSIVMREAQAMARFTGMVNRGAKNLAETRAFMLEFEERARRVEEMTAQASDERHTMSIIMGILDSETIKHTIHFQGLKKSVAELKRKIMEFVNLTLLSTNDPMDRGRVEIRHGWDKEVDEEWDEEHEDEEEEGHLNNFGNKCDNCDEFGHYSRECPGKGKGKGKPKGCKSFGNAKGKGKFGKNNPLAKEQAKITVRTKTKAPPTTANALPPASKGPRAKPC
jgi:polyhydroxyalkanoate synthesis regulator phasin